jgi:predicted tellurium resistance membrane protein TerC
MSAFLADPNVWASLLTLTALEIVLGIDNLIFLSIVSGRLPRHQQALARQLGLALALLGRIALLFSLTWIIGLTEPVVSVLGFDLSWRDIVLIVGGLFLLVKGTMETHHMLEGQEQDAQVGTSTFFAAVVQIIILDVVFALDSIITAVGMTDQLPVMIAAVVIAMVVMLVAANPVGDFVNNHPTVKMLALSFLLLVGIALIADGFHFHIPRGYLYFAIFFSGLVEALNLWAARSRKGRRHLDAAGRIVDDGPDTH